MSTPTWWSRLRRPWCVGVLAVCVLVSSTACTSADDATGVAAMDHPCDFFTTSELESLGLRSGRILTELETESHLSCTFRSETVNSSQDFIRRVGISFWGSDVDRMAAVLESVAGVEFMRREEDGLYWRELELEAFGPECGLLAATGESSAVHVSVRLGLASSDGGAFCQTVSRLAPFIEERIVPRPAG